MGYGPLIFLNPDEAGRWVFAYNERDPNHELHAQVMPMTAMFDIYLPDNAIDGVYVMVDTIVENAQFYAFKEIRKRQKLPLPKDG
jgi:hypothetical protein